MKAAHAIEPSRYRPKPRWFGIQPVIDQDFDQEPVSFHLDHNRAGDVFLEPIAETGETKFKQEYIPHFVEVIPLTRRQRIERAKRRHFEGWI